MELDWTVADTYSCRSELIRNLKDYTGYAAAAAGSKRRKRNGKAKYNEDNDGNYAVILGMDCILIACGYRFLLDTQQYTPASAAACYK